MDVTKTGYAGAAFLLPAISNNAVPAINGNLSSLSEISDLGRTLYQSNIDLTKSTFIQETGNTSYNIQFLRQSEQKISLNGYYSNDLTSGRISFSYNYLRTEEKEGKTIERKYEVNFDFSFKSTKSISIEKTEKKEDILDFLRRITREIFAKLNDNNVNITAVVLDPEDLNDLAILTDKKAKQLIYQLIEMIKYAVEAKLMANKNKAANEYIYHPKRIKESINETKELNELKIDYSFSMKEVSKTITAAGN